VRDVVGHLAHAAEQPLDLVEHGIEVGRQLVELVARALERDALAEIARHDAARGAIDRIDPPEHAPAHDEAAGQPEQQRERKAPAQRAPDLRLDLQPVLDLASDQQPVAVFDQKAGRARPSLLHRLAIRRDLDREGQRAIRTGRNVGPAVQVAGNGSAVRVGQQIDAGAMRLRRTAERDHLAQAIQSFRPVLLGQSGDLGLDRILGLALHEAGRGVVEKAEQRQRRDPKRGQIDQRQTERRGFKQPPQAHGHSNLPLARCESAAVRTRGRSSGADG
jgi:hypothetical protein